MAQEKTTEPRYRVYNFSTKLINVETGEPYITQEKIDEALEHKTIKRYGYILHDKDVYTEEDYKRELQLAKEQQREPNPDIIVGEPKPDHFHFVLDLGNSALPPSTIAKWFGLPDSMISGAKGRNAFINCVEYLTHESEKEQEKGKFLYPDEEVFANFDFREAINKKDEIKLKYGKDLSLKDQIHHDIFYNGMTLREAEKIDMHIYRENEDKYKKARNSYLEQRAPMPPSRINFYICGEGEVGKSYASRALARAMFPQIENDVDLFFTVGAAGVPFDGYDGQPVIIWNDFRADELLEVFNYKRGALYEMFDNIPTNKSVNIKYGKIKLINAVHIINGTEPYEYFLNQLTDNTVRSERQLERRFPIIIPLRDTDFDVLLNEKTFYDKNLVMRYRRAATIEGNFATIGKNFKELNERADALSAKLVLMPVKAAKYLEEKISKEHDIEESVVEKFGTETYIDPDSMAIFDTEDYETVDENYDQEAAERIKQKMVGNE